MPLLKKIFSVGGSRVVALPPDWLEYHERVEGRIPEYVAMEVDGEITIKPVYPEEPKEEKT